MKLNDNLVFKLYSKALSATEAPVANITTPTEGVYYHV